MVGDRDRIEPISQDSQLSALETTTPAVKSIALQTTPAVESVAQETTCLQAELHETQQDEPKPSLADKSKQVVEDPVLQYLKTALKKENSNIQKVLSDFLQDLQKKVRTAEERNEELLSHSIRILDSGGQPQFHELIAIFLSHISGFISVFKLNEALSDCGEVVLYDDGQPISDPYGSYYSHEQVIRHNLQAIQMKAMQPDAKEMPNLAFVGTFLDKKKECNETPDMKDKKLHSIINEMNIGKYVISPGKSLKQVTFQINAGTPEKYDFETVDRLKITLLEHSRVKPRDLPLKWHGLEVALHVMMEKLKQHVLRRNECEFIAYHLSFDLSTLELDEALDYLRQLNIIAYYDVLPDVIFGSSQVVLDKITELVCYSIVLKGERVLSGDQRNFVEQGIMSLHFLCSCNLKKHYIPGLFEPENLLEVLISQHVVSRVSEKEFIMPCVLEVSSIYPPPPIPEDIVHSSFILHFSKKSPMFGVYCCTIASLISDAGWKLLTEDGEVVQVARNSFTFEMPLDLPGKLIFRDPLSCYLEVILEYPDNVEAEHCEALYHEVRNDLFDGIAKARKTLHYDVVVPEVSFLCPKETCSKKPHPATLDKFQSRLRCSLKPNVCCCLTKEQKKWLQKPAGSTQPPASSAPSSVTTSTATQPTGCTPGKGKKTPEYITLKRNLSSTTRILSSAPGSKDQLCLKFMERDWLDITENPSEKDLVILALNRIEEDSRTFHELVKMLKEISGMDLVVGNLTTQLREF